jgi:hypothetical protein
MLMIWQLETVKERRVRKQNPHLEVEDDRSNIVFFSSSNKVDWANNVYFF